MPTSLRVVSAALLLSACGGASHNPKVELAAPLSCVSVGSSSERPATNQSYMVLPVSGYTEDAYLVILQLPKRVQIDQEDTVDQPHGAIRSIDVAKITPNSPAEVTITDAIEQDNIDFTARDVLGGVYITVQVCRP